MSVALSQAQRQVEEVDREGFSCSNQVLPL